MHSLFFIIFYTNTDILSTAINIFYPFGKDIKNGIKRVVYHIFAPQIAQKKEKKECFSRKMSEKSTPPASY